MELTASISSRPSTSRKPSINAPIPLKKPQQHLRFQTYQDQKCIQKLTYFIVRPPRIKYNADIYLKNPRPLTHKMATHQIPFDITIFSPLQQQSKYCVLYLHGNSSCRLEGMNMVKEIPDNVALACFDFEGCGNGKEEFITLGIRESRQANIAARFLEEKGYRVTGWGRSMGAASLLLSDIKIMVVDSAFSSIKDICTSVAEKQVKWMPYCLFSCLFSCVFCCVGNDFKSKTSESISKLSIIDRVRYDSDGGTKAAMFLSGNNDLAIDSSHSKKLFEEFKGYKDIQIFEGTHNSTRPPEVIKKCFQWIDQSMLLLQQRDIQRTNLQLNFSQGNQQAKINPVIPYEEPQLKITHP